MLSKFYFKNFEPELDIKLQSENLLERLEEAAPYSSAIVAILERNSDNYWAYVDVYSKWGTFVVTAQDSQIDRLLLAVEEKMKSKLGRWREERFPASLHRPRNGPQVAAQSSAVA